MTKEPVSRTLGVLSLVLLLTSCFGNGAKEEYFYNLTGPKNALEKGKGPRIQVNTFVPASGYDTARIAFRTTKHEIQYYGYRQWAAEPARMLTEMAIRQLRASGRFAEVASGDRLREPDAIIEASVDAIEQVDHEKSWEARLAMTFVVRKDSETVLLRHAFDETRPCARRHPDEVAVGVSNILATQVTRLAHRIHGAIR